MPLAVAPNDCVVVGVGVFEAVTVALSEVDVLVDPLSLTATLAEEISVKSALDDLLASEDALVVGTALIDALGEDCANPVSSALDDEDNVGTLLSEAVVDTEGDSEVDEELDGERDEL